MSTQLLISYCSCQLLQCFCWCWRGLPRLTHLVSGQVVGFDLDYIREQCFDERVLHAVELLTHAPGVPYDQYIRRIALNKLARRVKWADVGENYLHLHNITDIERRARLARKYAMALEILSEAELATN